ncbi:DUF421 domain-containing protein [Subsaximicrobium wynnwilliamsii]|uniref:DUF421 domain-containing protein n=1 Tax=Subsaximicrobium wynnwilliamsii TaxID=291179 RepID=A0A5C6ZKP3_9FLAO|nr:YetF domain-containing protein [Subsaximicrobium wynnwilliamsii]TXD81562.1 DUF421 domain-containing protein [Subsaximicrobium wynnwilliamsii]TXD89924.1 DUF421 domain-containing protein [Subsaximicrobium wynnwilliamsii]TXE01023.1 DUF421 domain-containing protein [Subsaximicrobium wynnwilliamsii]
MIHSIFFSSDTSNLLDKLFATTSKTLILIAVSTLGIYSVIILYTRLFGKRSFSKISSFDFAMTVAVGSMTATVILSDSVSFLEGATGLASIYAFQLLAAIMRRYKWFRKLIDNQPTLLMDGRNILTENMKAVRVTEGDLRSKLRESNVTALSQVKAVIFETTGNIVVLHNSGNDEIEDWLLKDVQR